ncbi:response regulator transcription factor, partial [bacterium]|nr:response regulator transcription factor [bacterium]
MPRILIVEDEPLIVDVLQIALRREGFTDVVAAPTARQALASAAHEPFDLAVLDIGLPDISGLEVAVALRRHSPDISVLFLTARDSNADKLMGFGVGGDDYVTKPFDPLEVVARVRALLRRTSGRAEGGNRRYDFGHFEVRPDEGRLIVEGRDVAVPAREFQLLAFLAANRDTIYSASDIYRAVWGEDPIGAADQNTVSVHVHRLRNRIEPDPAHPQYLVSIRGLGYKLVMPTGDRERLEEPVGAGV